MSPNRGENKHIWNHHLDLEMGENLTNHFLPYESASSNRDLLIDSPK